MSAISATAIIDAFYLCLAASVIWAPIVFLGAAFLNRRSGGAAEAALWPTALIVAIMPVIAAPISAGLGLSLRTSKPLAPMSTPQATAIDLPATAIIAEPSRPFLDVAMVLNAAADLYFYGFVLFAALGVIRLVGFSYRIRYSDPVTDTALVEGLNEWRQIMGVRRSVRYAYSDVVSSVCVHGFVRPVILMPPSLLERASTKDAILMGAHELAHVKRGDTVLFAFCGLAKALFWFNPFMRRIIAHAQLAAEQAADALVIKRGVNRRSYARCFVESLKLSSGLAAPQYELVPSFTPFDKRSRRKRLDAILSGRTTGPVISLGGKIVLVASGMLALVLAFGQAALAVAPPPAKQALSVVPVEGRITSSFGVRMHPIEKVKRFHSGMDIAAPTGTPVRAAGDGKVVAATPRYNGSDAWGNVVVVDHGHGLVTRYAQLDSYIVHKGDSVEAGDTIGAVGATGRATGPHLHFEVLVDGEHVDPAPVVVPDVPRPPMPRATRRATLAPEAILPPSAAAPKDVSALQEPIVEPGPEPIVEMAIEPAPEPMPAPTVEPSPEPAPPAPDPEEFSFGERLELHLAGKIEEWTTNLDENLEGIEGITSDIQLNDMDFRFDNGMDFRFDDVEIKVVEGLDELVEIMGDTEFGQEIFDVIVEEIPNYAFVIDGTELSDEDRRKIERAREKATRAAEASRREVQQHIEKARRQMERALKDRERTMRDTERETRAQERKTRRDAERQMREHEHTMREHERTMREQERAMRKQEQAIRDQEQAIRNAEREQRKSAEQEAEMLKLREEALREAEESLARERAELERMRAELEVEKRNKD